MAIIQKIILSVNEYDVRLSTPIKLFMGDSVTLVFRIKTANMGRKSLNDVWVPMGSLDCTLIVDTMNGTYKVKNILSEDDFVSFKLSERETNMPGVHKMQIIIRDEDGCKITIPEFEFEVREPIPEDGRALVGTFNCGVFKVGHGIKNVEDVAASINEKTALNIDDDFVKEAIKEAINEQKEEMAKEEDIKDTIKEVIGNIGTGITKDVIKETIIEIIKENKSYHVETFEVGGVTSSLSDKFKKRLKKVGEVDGI